jgi:hypothetical protein
MGFSEEGAVGCMFRIFQEMDFLLRFCPDAASASGVIAISGRLKLISDFVAMNSFPSVSQNAMQAMSGLAQTEFRVRLDRQCPDKGSELSDFARSLAGSDLRDSHNAPLAIPRLPVANPCL